MSTETRVEAAAAEVIQERKKKTQWWVWLAGACVIVFILAAAFGIGFFAARKFLQSPIEKQIFIGKYDHDPNNVDASEDIADFQNFSKLQYVKSLSAQETPHHNQSLNAQETSNHDQSLSAQETPIVVAAASKPPKLARPLVLSNTKPVLKTKATSANDRPKWSKLTADKPAATSIDVITNSIDELIDFISQNPTMMNNDSTISMFKHVMRLLQNNDHIHENYAKIIDLMGQHLYDNLQFRKFATLKKEQTKTMTKFITNVVFTTIVKLLTYIKQQLSITDMPIVHYDVPYISHGVKHQLNINLIEDFILDILEHVYREDMQVDIKNVIENTYNYLVKLHDEYVNKLLNNDESGTREIFKGFVAIRDEILAIQNPEIQKLRSLLLKAKPVTSPKKTGKLTESGERKVAELKAAMQPVEADQKYASKPIDEEFLALLTGDI